MVKERKTFSFFLKPHKVSDFPLARTSRVRRRQFPAGAHTTVLVNDAAPKEYENIEKYTTPGGLNQIMR